MKKIILIILLLTITLIYQIPEVEASLTIIATTEETNYIEGVRHTKIVGQISYTNPDTEETLVTNQVINYMGGHVSVSPDTHIIVGDDYSDYAWGMNNLHALKENVHRRYDNYRVIAGVNGDFYNMTTGHPVAGYIRNFEVLTTGQARPLAGFKDNGQVVFGIPEYSGYEFLVYDEEGALKKRTPVAGINRLPSSSSEVTVFFEDYSNTIGSGYEKIVISATDIKRDDWKTRYFGKGGLLNVTNEEVNVLENQFVIVGNEVNAHQLVTSRDYVVLQRKIVGAFQDVRFGIGVWEKLVENGVPLTTWSEGAIPYSRAPRTAIGVTVNGSVFFVTVDGRQSPKGMDGVTHREMAQIMFKLGARTAYNLDGGGSTTALVKDVETETYHIVNSPSDGNIRPISNGLFIVKGYHQPILDPIPFPDYREILSTPKQIRIDHEGNLRFESVPYANRYKIYINENVYETESNVFPLLLPEGAYEIKIRAYGDRTLFRPSEYSMDISYYAYPEQINKFMDLFRQSLRKSSYENQSE
jgi:hypothetical protein